MRARRALETPLLRRRRRRRFANRVLRCQPQQQQMQCTVVVVVVVVDDAVSSRLSLAVCAFIVCSLRKNPYSAVHAIHIAHTHWGHACRRRRFGGRARVNRGCASERRRGNRLRVRRRRRRHKQTNNKNTLYSPTVASRRRRIVRFECICYVGCRCCCCCC